MFWNFALQPLFYGRGPNPYIVFPYISSIGSSMRGYTKGAEKLFHRVNWDRAVGLVIVVDPFDPGSLLYLPQAGYTDLIKTALANRSPLVVVHGLDDEVPTISEDVDGKITYLVYSVSGREVHRVPRTSQNSPPGRTPTTKSSGSSPSGSQSPSLDSPLGKAIHASLKKATWQLTRRGNAFAQSLRSWQSFLPKDFGLAGLRDKWSGIPYSHKRRPYCCNGNVEATLLHRFTWVGATMLARSARSLEWAFAILGKFLILWQKNGLKIALKNFSEARRVLMKYLSGYPESASSSGGIPLGISKGLPTLLPRGMRRYIAAGHVTAIRLAFFMLNLADSMKYQGPVNISNITDPYKGVISHTPELELEIAQAVKELKTLHTGQLPSRLRWNGFHTTVKAGPHGRALYSAPLDAVALYTSELFEHWEVLCNRTAGGRRLYGSTVWLAKVTGWFCKPFWAGTIGYLANGKISQVIEPRGKIRTVAIPGYQIQCILRPLHDWLFKFLRGLETDHTFDQDKGVRRAMESKHLHMNSYDLSAATDRFPLWFQELVLKYLLEGVVENSAAYATAWACLLRGISFSFKRTPNGVLNWIKYGSGQPMGCYSSWAAFAVSHHVLVRIAAKRGGFENFLDYELLGDDILLRGDTPSHKPVFSQYLSLMRGLGVGVNPSKGVESLNGTFEFAKRFVRGNEVLSSLRWKELCSVTSWAGVFGLLLSVSRRGLPLPHLRVALEVGYVLVTGIPFRRPLTDPRRVNLWGYREFTDALILLTSPVGPYKVPMIGWLSGRGTFHVDFHPNLGHFFNSIDSVFMEHEVHYPIFHGLEAVRRAMVDRILETSSTAFGVARSLSRSFWSSTTTHVNHEENTLAYTHYSKDNVSSGVGSMFKHRVTPSGQVLDNLQKVWTAVGPKMSLAYRDHPGLVDEIRSTLGEFLTKPAQLLHSAGMNAGQRYNAAAKRVNELLSNKTIDETTVHVLRISEDHAQEFSNLSDDLMIGLLRTIIAVGPARMVNMRGLMDLLGTKSPRADAIKQFDPDGSWLFGRSSEAIDRGSAASDVNQRMEAERVAYEYVDALMPAKYRHPSQLLHECKGCITDYMKVSVADILPSALPPHLDLFQAWEEATAQAVLKSYRMIRSEDYFRAPAILAFREMTNVKAGPAYLLGYTNGVRVDPKLPGVVPPAIQLEARARFLTDALYRPLVYSPAPGYAEHFANLRFEDVPNALQHQNVGVGIPGFGGATNIIAGAMNLNDPNNRYCGIPYVSYEKYFNEKHPGKNYKAPASPYKNKYAQVRLPNFFR